MRRELDITPLLPLRLVAPVIKTGALLVCWLAITSFGCRQFNNPSFPHRDTMTPKVAEYDRGLVSDGISSNRPDQSFVAQRPGSLPTTGEAWPRSDNTAPLVVRGQNDRLGLTPSFEVAADGGKYTRTPLPIGGLPDSENVQTAVGTGAHYGRYDNGILLTQHQTPAQQGLPGTNFQSWPNGEVNSPSTGTATTTGPSVDRGIQSVPSVEGSSGSIDTLPPPAIVSGGNASSDVVGSSVSQTPQAYQTPPTVNLSDPSFGNGGVHAPAPYVPLDRTADIVMTGTPGKTGRVTVGGAVNSDAGITGNITIDERNFDIWRWPTSFRDLFGGTAFRGAGQTFRLEASPGSDFQRYNLQFGNPNVAGYLPISSNYSVYLNDRQYRDWEETRVGGRIAFGYNLTPDLSLSAGIKAQQVDFKNPRITGIPQVQSFVGEHDLYAFEFRLSHDTRNSPFSASEGHFLEWKFEQTFGDFDYSRSEIDFRKYFLIRQRADGSGRHTLSLSTQFRVSGEQTPVFENFFAGGYSTLRGFDFRGASPVIGGLQVGGRMQWVNSIEYTLPLTADDAFQGVAFVDFGTVERDFDLYADNFRVAPGVGIRVAIPALGPSPLAFDFAFPVAEATGDEKQVFSFYMSAQR